jgi:hypothetical protein
MLTETERYAHRDDQEGAKMRVREFQAGWAVVGNDDQRLGTVKHVGQNYIRTSRPGFSADLYVPVSFIANVENQTIHLNITRHDSEQMGWEQVPRDDELEAGPESDLHRHV